MTAVIATPEAPAPEPVLAIGESIAAQVGRVVINLQRVMVDAWAITVYEGTRREHDLCTSHASETEAGLIASGLLAMYRQEATS